MAIKKKKQNNILLILLVAAAAIGFIVYLTGTVQQGAGTTVTEASKESFLSSGDDALSLQEDLKNLGKDPGAGAEQELNAIQ